MVVDRIVTLEQIKKDIKTHADIYEISPYNFGGYELHEYYNQDGSLYHVDSEDGKVFYRSHDPREFDKHIATVCNKDEFAKVVHSEKHNQKR